MTLFSDVLASITSSPDQTIQLPTGWGQGRALFGGITAAIAWQHAQYGVTPDQHLHSFTVSFVAPVQPGPVQLQRRVLREGGNVTQISVEFIQAGAVVLAALATYGKARSSAVQVQNTPSPQIPPVEQALKFPPTAASLLPEFTQFFDYAITVGGLPFSGVKSNEFGGWMRFKHEQHPITIGLLLGLVDAWPPAVLMHLTTPCPASSLTWTIEFPTPLPESASSHDWWQYRAIIDHAADGYGHTQAHIWDAKNRLVAISRQTVTVFG